MNDEEFDQVSEILFNSVTSIKRIGQPGVLIPLSKDTRAVLCGNNSFDVIIVAIRFGQGRGLVFSHNGYLSLFTKTQENEDEAHFVNNCKQWLSKGSSNEVLNIHNVKAMKDVNTDGKILLWDGHNSKNVEFMNDLCEYLQSGGSLVCGSTPWGWVQLNKGKQLSDFPFTSFCNNLGVKLTKSVASCPNPISFRSELKLYSIIEAAIKQIDEISPDLSTDLLVNMVTNATQDVIPVHSCPIKDKTCRDQSQGLCDMMCLLPGIKAPGVSSFPGDFNEPPQFETDVLCTVESNAKELFCTGCYVAAGTSIQIDVVEQKGATDWSVRIGCHIDDIRNCNEFRRWNCISICKSLTTASIEMCSAFGGLLFLQSPEKGSSSITVNIHRVVLTPSYNLSDPNRAETWQYQQGNAQGLWADIAGKHIVFNVPSTSIRQLDSAQLDRALEFWDSIVLAHHDLIGTKPTHRERIVCDEQPSAGYMHSGYPIVTHLDVSDPKSKKFLFDIETLEKEGSWGLFHELGHNRQNSSWTFEGTGEVTVNIFTLHAMDIVCHKTPWIHGWLQNQIPDAKKYISNGSKFDEWKKKPGIALFIYAQLAREYGWENYKAIFRKYNELNPKLKSNQEKIDYWITTFSHHVGHTLIPLFKFWGFPISQSTIDSLVNLKIPSITDELIQVAPERYKI